MLSDHKRKYFNQSLPSCYGLSLAINFLRDPINFQIERIIVATLRKSETYTVHIVRDPSTGTVIDEAWLHDGELHRRDGPARIDRDPSTGTVIEEAWLQDGELHRLDGPAFIEHDPKTGTFTYEAWWKDDKRHRLDGPAVIKRDPSTGIVTYKSWFRTANVTASMALRSSSATPAPAPSLTRDGGRTVFRLTHQHRHESPHHRKSPKRRSPNPILRAFPRSRGRAVVNRTREAVSAFRLPSLTQLLESPRPLCVNFR